MRHIILTAAVLLAGCDKADVKACEDYILDGLRSPSTYERIEVTRSESPVAPADYDRIIGVLDGSIGAAVKKADLSEGVAVRSLYVSYDAQNAFGAPVRNIEECKFKVVGGKLDDATSLRTNVLLATNRRLLAQVNGDPPEKGCCL